MARGGVGGQGLRGGQGAVDSATAVASTTPDDHYYRQDAAAADTDRLYAWGWRGGGGSIATQSMSFLSGGANVLHATPEIFPRAGRIKRLMQYYQGSTTPSASNLWRLGIYRNNTDIGNMYPAALAWDGGEKVGNGGPRVDEYAPDLAVSAGELLWFANVCNANAVTNAVTVHFLNESAAFSPLGSQYKSGGAAIFGGTLGAPQPQIGWRNAFTYGALPTTFPGSPGTATRIDNRGANRTIMVGWISFLKS